MAMVDFTNAKIVPLEGYTRPVFDPGYVNLYTSTFKDAVGNTINTNGTRNVLINESKRLVLSFSGAFTTSGTEFYITATSGSPVPAKWRVYNISFQNGDTYSFEIPINLICN